MKRLLHLSFLLVLASAEPKLVFSADISWTELEPRSGPRGETLFRTLTPQETGITAINDYADPRMWTELFQEFTTGAIGTGIAIGDFDGDGLPDVFLVSKTGENHLYKNLGHFRFLDVTSKAGIAGPTDAWKQGAVFVDVDNDGKLDIFVCRRGAPNLLYINQGDGTFKEEAAARGLALVDGSANAAFEDYDRDGALDLFLQTNLLDAEVHATGERNHLYHNDGHGYFTEVTDQAGISNRRAQGHSATWWDFNEDGWPDLYVANDFNEPDCLYRNNGDGTFTDVISEVTHHIPQSSMGADLGDLTHDGHLDLVVTEMAPRSRQQDQQTAAPMRALQSIDGNADAPRQVMRNAVFLNTGVGRFQDAAFLTGLAATDWTWSVRLEDLDNDGWTDAYFTNGMVREFRAADLLQKMSTVESISERNQLMASSPVLQQRHIVFRNRGNLQFEDVSAAWGLDQNGVSFGAALGDLDRDGDLDVVVSNYQAPYTICRNDSESGHRVIIDLRGTVSNRFGIGATVRLKTTMGWQVRRLTLNRGYLSSSEPMIHFGLGDCDRIEVLSIEWPSGAAQTFKTLSADRRYTIIEPEKRNPLTPGLPTANSHDGSLFTDVTAKYNLDPGFRRDESPAEFRLSTANMGADHRGPFAAAIASDGGASETIFVGATSDKSAKRLERTEGGGYLAFGAGALSPSQGPTLFFDINGDGNDDALASTLSSKPAKPRVLINDGHGNFVPDVENRVPNFAAEVGVFASADYNHDGSLDVFVGGIGNEIDGDIPVGSALWENRNGHFYDVTDTIVPGLRKLGSVTSAVWSDVDGDGWIDLIVATDWDSIHYFHNDQGRSFTELSGTTGFTSAGRGRWTALATADFNQDGRPDFVLGNVGLNTRFSASPENPLVLLSGLRNGRAETKSVLAHFDHGQLYAIASKPAMLSSFPELTRKLPTFTAYADTNVDTLFSNQQSPALRSTVTQLASGVLLSQPDGTYRFATLPRLAQLAPIYGIEAVDVDGDGNTDLVLVGNSFAWSLDKEQLDGAIGYILRGDGHGNFLPIPPGESGWIVPGEAKTLVMTDINQDGYPDFFISRKDSGLLAFQHRSTVHRPISIRLHGSKGNPHAIGAAVSVRSSRGQVQMAEVRAGSGSFAQSTPDLFFTLVDDGAIEITISWPDGTKSTSRLVQPAARVELRE